MLAWVLRKRNKEKKGQEIEFPVCAMSLSYYCYLKLPQIYRESINKHRLVACALPLGGTAVARTAFLLPNVQLIVMTGCLFSLSRAHYFLPLCHSENEVSLYFIVSGTMQ